MALGSIHGTSSACGLSLLLALSVLAGDEGFLCEYSTSAAKTKSLTFTQELSTHSSPPGVIFFRDLAKKERRKARWTRLHKPHCMVITVRMRAPISPGKAKQLFTVALMHASGDGQTTMLVRVSVYLLCFYLFIIMKKKITEFNFPNMHCFL